MEPEDIQLFNLFYRASSGARRDLAKNLIEGKDEFVMPKTYTSRVNEIFAVYLKSLGIKIEFVDDEDEIREYDDDHINVYTLDDEEYMCTEYQFMLLKRKKEIEKEVLANQGLMDADEFKKLVMEHLKNTDYVIGPDKSEYDNVPAFKEDTVVDETGLRGEV